MRGRRREMIVVMMEDEQVTYVSTDGLCLKGQREAAAMTVRGVTL